MIHYIFVINVSVSSLVRVNICYEKDGSFKTLRRVPWIYGKKNSQLK